MSKKSDLINEKIDEFISKLQHDMKNIKLPDWLNYDYIIEYSNNFPNEKQKEFYNILSNLIEDKHREYKMKQNISKFYNSKSTDNLPKSFVFKVDSDSNLSDQEKDLMSLLLKLTEGNRIVDIKIRENNEAEIETSKTNNSKGNSVTKLRVDRIRITSEYSDISRLFIFAIKAKMISEHTKQSQVTNCFKGLYDDEDKVFDPDTYGALARQFEDAIGPENSSIKFYEFVKLCSLNLSKSKRQDLVTALRDSVKW
jgi:hypothetical protein